MSQRPTTHETHQTDGSAEPTGPPATRRRLFGSLCTMVFLVNFARVVFAPLLEPFVASFAISRGSAALVATLAWLGSALPRIPTGYLLTRVSRHRVVLGTGLLLTAAAGFTAFADSFVVLATGAFLMGTASGAYFIAANPLVSELYPERVGRAIGVHGMASQVAAVVAPLFVGLVLAVGTWRGVFVAMSAAAAVATAVLYYVARTTDDMPDAGVADRDLLGALRRQWPIIATGVAIMGATGFVWNGLFNLYVSYLVDVKALSESTGRALLTVVFAAGVPAFVLTGRLADRVRHVPLMLAILGGFAGSLLVLTAVESLLAIAVVTAVIGYVIHSLFPALDTYLLDSLPDENRASAYAVYSGAMMIIGASGSWVLGSLTDLGIPFDPLFRIAAVGLFVVLAVLVVLYRAGRLATAAN